ncbi:hypothetical protein BCR35DRAFT_307768 [Leucosporidium creatinivorum]|uniref:SRR1-like domain-containing protein n=1 Tax=Leucosporidium creatinivorum TaxID=106004 RepID=A0A1Y2EN01_9BASI|nr:hypothetical protein BCR35DRAFT_307768 [Leucosporidium creatinivorum]
MPADVEDFTHVSHKKVRTPKNRKGKSNRPRERSVAERVEARRGALVESGYLASCRELLRNALLPSSQPGAPSPCPPPVSLVCLGLGSVADSRKSQEQFILLQELIAEIGDALQAKTTIYDPVFAEEDYEYFMNEGLDALKAEHDLTFDTVTLLYMPHCPRPLFNELIRKNWDPAKLRRLVLLGNRLDMYDDPTHPSATSSSKSPYISKAEHLEAFNDLALQWAPSERIEGKPASFWDELDESAATEAERQVGKAENKKEDEKKREMDRIQNELVAALSRTTLE